MTLDEWKKRSNLSDTEIAAAIGVSRLSVFRYRQGEMMPRKKVMLKIVEMTGGKVLPSDFYL